MLEIGITGGIGSGKTTVCKFFALQNIPVFYADAHAKEIMHADKQLIIEIKHLFGEDMYSDEGVLQKSKLAAQVFNDENKLKLLNSIVHPAVFRAFDFWKKHQNAPYVLKEAAVLFESGSHKGCDYTVLVKSPQTLRVSRIMERDQLSEQDIIMRMSKQLPEAEKEKLADLVVINNEKELLIPQLLMLHEKFLRESDKRSYVR